MDKTNKDALDQAWVKDLISQPILARLGTANPKNAQPHVTPVWYEWDGEYLYISVFVSTRKAKEVSANSRISVLVDAEEPLRGILFEGKAELLADPVEVHRLAKSIYTRYVGEEDVKGDPYNSWIDDPENRIIRLNPEHVYVWKY